MHPSVRCFSAARAHQPLIKFLGKRTYPSNPDVPHAHPAAPTEFKQRFSEWVKSVRSPETAPEPVAKASPKADTNQSNVSHYDDYWEAPSRFWRPRVRYIEEDEMDAIMVRYQLIPDTVLTDRKRFVERRCLQILIYLRCCNRLLNHTSNARSLWSILRIVIT
ncbi:hypothetical protein B0H34DRAFT_647798 [Crassisporium funariophilum]|nr:hypothetical protein B0H34DRAFT_647798 [Crassisporium funariophilum]